ncbi:hypothetical protein [Candidatus Marithrix sp. Canyon 246]|uniref:hypothetical protein n=3 Tax=Candidatus Marithrix sp. Canyon 246 TaxID=1827136 RepID=UPI00084A2B22|nr:hypothetical protein [Candidatus Marithrix sp. Canyon 246]
MNMRKIDKTQILATAYKSWIRQLEKNNQIHSKYYSSHKYYKDVLVSLLFCQQGLCAYTEIMIAETERCSPNNFDQAGRYIEKTKQESSFSAQLDHFDSSLKEKYGWRWENFFAISDKINIEKGAQPVDEILKPDFPKYNPYKLLDYNEKRHLFHAHPDIKDENIVERIENMILVLGLNQGTIKDNRRAYLEPKKKSLLLGKEIEPVYQFFTAFEMLKQNLL